MTADINWDAATEETVRNLSALIQANTTNPPGNERPAAELCARELGAAGLAGHHAVGRGP